jgi:hypothetical protein
MQPGCSIPQAARHGKLLGLYAFVILAGAEAYRFFFLR